MNVTQSTVSARIRVLEDHLACRLFERSSTGVNLTAAGRQFYRYAASMQQLWQQGLEEIRQSGAYSGSVGVGVHMTMWRSFMPAWLIWMRKTHPEFSVHVEADYSERLTEYVRQGILDVAITHMPRALPGLSIEEFSIDRLIMVSSKPRTLSTCENGNYLHVDWSYGYREEHLEKLPQLQIPVSNIGYGEIAMEYLLHEDGCAYLPYSIVREHLSCGRLYQVEDAPEFARPSYLVRQTESVYPERIEIAIEGLKLAVGA